MTDKPTDVFRSADWDIQRRLEERWNGWFNNNALTLLTTGVTDPDTGEPQRRFPIAVNYPKVYAEIHRDVMFGISRNYDEVPVRTVLRLDNGGDVSAVQAVHDQIWRDSNGTALQNEAGLLMQIRGGHAFKVAWEPDNSFLRYRTRIVSLKSSMIFPIYNETDYWNLEECYVGYYIDEEEAKTRYGVDVHGSGVPVYSPSGDNRMFHKWVLYVEHWTKDEYQITIENKVARKNLGGTWVNLEGKHNFGRVPIVYFPHHRAGSFYGTSHIDDIQDLAKELADIKTDKGDVSHSLSHPLLIGKNIRDRQVKMIPIWDAKKENIIAYYVDAGTAAMNQPEPSLEYASPPQIPDSVANISNELKDDMQFMVRVTDAAIGEQDVSSGRATGKFVGSNMMPVIQHTQTERMDFTMALSKVTDIELSVIEAKRPALAVLGIEVPKITDEIRFARKVTVWNPAIPMDVSEQATILIERLKNNGVDLETYLEKMGEIDPADIRAKIIADLTELAKIEAMKRPAPVAGATSGGFNQP